MAHRNPFPYGNYLNYYESRSAERWKDARMSVLPAALFTDKRVLDIGCNDGTLSLLLAYRHNPVSLLGLDIDYRLINRAVENWTRLEHWQDRGDEAQTLLQEVSTFPLSYRLQLRESGDIQTLQDVAARAIGKKAQRFPGNVDFLVGNVLTTPLPGPFDTVLCLSTSKWIHLNWGDAGISRLFALVHSALLPGGHFVFEPQPWSSYKKLRNQSLRLRTTYEALTMRPKQFEEEIVQTGFEVESRVVPAEGKDKFKRDITIYRKV